MAETGTGYLLVVLYCPVVLSYVIPIISQSIRALPVLLFFAGIPRGLIPNVLFYKVSFLLKPALSMDGILFFVILSTGLFLFIAMIAYKKQNEEVRENPVFLKPKALV